MTVKQVEKGTTEQSYLWLYVQKYVKDVLLIHWHIKTLQLRLSRNFSRSAKMDFWKSSNVIQYIAKLREGKRDDILVDVKEGDRL